MEKTGRNDPCPCGSGKKYKKCCLPLEQGIGSGKHIEDILQYTSKWILDIDWLKDDFEAMKHEYIGKNVISDDLYCCLLDAFMFDFILPKKRMTPFHYFLYNANLSPRFKEIYMDFTRNTLTFFEVIDIDINHQ